ncbi:FecR family protein [Flavobacterium rhizosphaerae]|uniref:FecR domain-containing protein n=1 Tax=Flavobacterium rhizosphaerae TaxID=3163298 RepID=A0ABW8Z2F8_9FLAO
MKGQYNKIFKNYSRKKASAKEERTVNIFFDKMQQVTGFQPDLVPDNAGAIIYSKIETALKPKTKKRSYMVAASVAALLLLGGLLFTFLPPTSSVHTITVTARLGEQQKVLLPDASVVYLNAGSSITYPEKFGELSRNVTLEGEAYFEVEHDKKHPFIISSDNFKTQVLGTKFTVSNYEGAIPSVTVVSGKVKVTDVYSLNSEIVTRNQRVIYNKQTALLVKTQNITAPNYIAWMEGRVYFEHASISEVLQTLHLRYNVDFTIDSPIYNCNTISGNFSGKDIKNVLESIKFINDMDFKIKDNNTITITLKPCK